MPLTGAYLYFKDPQPATNADVDPVFPSSIPVKSRGSNFSIADHPDLSATDGKDFIFFGWFKFDGVPDEGQRMSLVTKIDFSKPTRPGFAIEVSRRDDYFRPSVYWKNAGGQGAEYDFSDFKMVLGAWYGFVVTYRQPNILGLHVVTIKDSIKADSVEPDSETDDAHQNKKPLWTLLGGYELKIPIFPFSPKVPMTVGAPQFGIFRGAVGPIGVISGPSASKNLRGLLKVLAKSPLDVARYIPKQDLIFLTTDGTTDVGPNKLAIEASTKLTGS